MTTTTQTATVSLKRAAIPLLLGAVIVLGVTAGKKALAPYASNSASHNSAVEPASCRLVLTPLSGDKPIDQEIARQQALALKNPSSAATLERLGWTFVKKARLSFDAGFYKLAEQTAACMDARGPKVRTSESTFDVTEELRFK